MATSIQQVVSELLSDHPEICGKLSARLNLNFANELREANVCFHDSHEVRPEFRTVFTTTDVADFLSGFYGASCQAEITKENFHLTFPYPANAAAFWKCVQQRRTDVV